MQHLAEFVAIATALAVGTASPGPSFVMVARTSAGAGRGNGLLAALGMGAGGLLFAIVSLLGLHGVLQALPSLYLPLKVAGGLYLAYLGYLIWRSAHQPLDAVIQASGAPAPASPRYLWLGLTTQLSNPKTAIVYASVFAAFLPVETSLAFKTGIASLVFVFEASWYALVALLLSLTGPRTLYLRGKKWFDRAAGCIMVGLGAKLIMPF